MAKGGVAEKNVGTMLVRSRCDVFREVVSAECSAALRSVEKLSKDTFSNGSAEELCRETS